MKAIEQYFHVVLFIMLYKVVLAFKAVDKTLVCGNSNQAVEQYFHLVLNIMLYDLGGLNFQVCGRLPSV